MCCNTQHIEEYDCLKQFSQQPVELVSRAELNSIKVLRRLCEKNDTCSESFSQINIKCKCIVVATIAGLENGTRTHNAYNQTMHWDHFPFADHFHRYEHRYDEWKDLVCVEGLRTVHKNEEEKNEKHKHQQQQAAITMVHGIIFQCEMSLSLLLSSTSTSPGKINNFM